jgi:hypothetical protein
MRSAVLAFLNMIPTLTLLGQAESPNPPAMAGGASETRNLFQSDMTLMNGMVPVEPMAGMRMPWHLMDVGLATGGYDSQGGPSGGQEGESVNWNMLHLQGSLGPGLLSVMMMNSLEVVTFPKEGSHELFQTGESYQGRPLVDRQHPHDFFMNLSATYRFPLGAEAGAWLQVAPVGEPAIGPTAYMHRASSGENHTAPLSHHWQDSTHIAFNVITLGGGWRWFALDGSVFHGQEPDEHRWNIDGGAIDSASGRLRVLLPDGWSGQVSYAFLKNPEPTEPGDLHRLSASVSYGASGDRPFAASLIWGRNVEAAGTSDSALLEGAWQITALDQVYGRAEWVQKDEFLLLTKHLPPPGLPVRLAGIGAFTAGYFRDFRLVRGLDTGLGGDVTLYAFPRGLEAAYGSFPVSGHVFARLRWGRAALIEMESEHAMPHHSM